MLLTAESQSSQRCSCPSATLAEANSWEWIRATPVIRMGPTSQRWCGGQKRASVIVLAQLVLVQNMDRWWECHVCQCLYRVGTKLTVCVTKYDATQTCRGTFMFMVRCIVILHHNNPTRCSCAQSVSFHCSVTLHVSGAFHTHHQEYIKLYLQPPVQVILS